jgi:AbrB family looped-hinge helix DNA binding protein
MTVATLTKKGQVTIPKSVRESMGLNTGDKLEFTLSDNGGAFFRPVTKKVDEVFGILHQPGRKAVSIEEMDAALKSKMRAENK